MTDRAQPSTRPMRLLFDPWTATQQELASASAAHPRFADLRNLMGLYLLERGEPARALAEFEAALEVNPGYHQARLNRLVALRHADGVLDDAAWSAESGASDLPEPLRTLWTGWYLAQRGDLNGATMALRRLDPRHGALGAFHEAMYAVQAGKRGEARDAIARAAGTHQLYRRILEERGRVGARGAMPAPSGQDGLLSSARPRAQGAPDTCPRAPSLGALDGQMGMIAARAGAAEIARGFYEDAFLMQGDESLYLTRLARLSLARGDEEEAVRTLCSAIELDPTSLDARVALGFEYQSQGYQNEAVVQFEVAARLQPGYPDIQYNLGLLYEAQGREADAVRCHKRALEIHPSYFQARVSLAQLLLRQGQHREALSELQPIVQAGVRSADLLVQQAEARLALNETSEAVDLLEQALALNPAYPRTYYVLGQAYRAAGLKRKAQEAWRQHLEHARRWQERQPLAAEEERRA